MNLVKTFLIFFNLCFLVFSKKYEFPSYIQRCNVNDPKINECVLKSTELVRPILIKGVPELGFPSILNFEIPEASFNQETQSVNISGRAKNVKTKGLETYRVPNFEFDVTNLQYFATLTLADIDLEGDYEVLGAVLGVEVKGEGRFRAGIDSCTFDVFMKVEKYAKNDETHLRAVNTTVSFKGQGPKLHVEGLVDSSKVINSIIADNIEGLFQDINPLIEKVIANLIDEFFETYLFKNIPFNKIFIV